MSHEGSSASGKAPRGQADINSLDDDLLALVLGHLPLSHRIGQCSLVSRRWHAVCHSAQLLQTVKCGPAYPTERLLPKLRSLQRWMLRHASHVERLEMGFFPQFSNFPTEAHMLVAGVLVACSAAGRLRQLSLDAMGWPFVVSSWAERLSRLESLHILARNIEFTASVDGLTNLQRLELRGQEVEMLPSVRLPPSITHVKLSARELPPQILALPGLKSIDVSSLSQASAASMSGLSRLAGSLHRMSVANMALPHGLSALTGLLELKLCDLRSTQAAAVGPAIGSLTQLTSLWLEVSGLEPPPQLANLVDLRRLLLCRGEADPEEDEMNEDEMAGDEDAFPDGVRPGLPAGAWLSGLTRLSLSLPQLLDSQDALQGATRLQRLDVLRVCCTNHEFFYRFESAWLHLWDWVAALPPLQTVSLIMNNKVECAVVDALVRLAQRRPALRISRLAELPADFW